MVVGASSKNNEAKTGRGAERWSGEQTPLPFSFFTSSTYVQASLSTRLYARSKNSTRTNWCEYQISTRQ